MWWLLGAVPREQTSNDALGDVFRFAIALARFVSSARALKCDDGSQTFGFLVGIGVKVICSARAVEQPFTDISRLGALGVFEWHKGGAADIAGDLKAGDRIIGVGQAEDAPMVDVIGWRLDDVVALIRGPKDTLVRLELIPTLARKPMPRKC